MVSSSPGEERPDEIWGSILHQQPHAHMYLLETSLKELLHPSGIFTNEGRTVTLAVKLPSQLSHETTVTLASYPHFAISVSPSTLTFTPENWNTPQAVKVTGLPGKNGLSAWPIVAVEIAEVDSSSVHSKWTWVVTSAQD